MKARLEDANVQFRGVIIEAEDEEERRVLMDIWHSLGRPVSIGNLRQLGVQLIVAPCAEARKTGTAER
jgi:hypothetical protein